MEPCSVQILLSTWNGERWLPELLESLRWQTFQNWQLLVRDDGSNDQTLRILLEWQDANPEKVAGILSDGVHLGSTQSFSRLVEFSTAPYLLFCDQDDVWFPEKVELQYTRLRSLQGEYGAETPLLVHSDLAVVDRHRELLSASFWEYRGFDVEQERWAYLLDNVVTGCATAFNRTAADMAFPLPAQAMQHDRWLALVCAWFGHIRAIPHPLLLYRQHEGNAIGAQAGTLRALDARVQAWGGQAEAFLQRFGERMAVADYRRVEALADLPRLHGWERRQHIVRHRLFKHGVWANLALLLFA
ncbi:MAG: glycosyltransferase family 2 protein [Thiothrix sp.]|jgi:glycosyltransferase involved in cell wall biosynthesis|uniref:glycosyltransferase family 2 protein n=1 Tax=Thiothrix sp. TaxID=1032 RepID=UPI002639F5E2|nr:glycosyltransferase family 2 protein [Thiothrix sp.]MDD5393355.1 glycosyltransferase family 2 protein [Thiothrix sp.]